MKIQIPFFKIAVLFFIVLFSNCIHAQIDVDYNLNVTPKITTFNYDIDQENNGNPTFNFSAGLNVDIGLGKLVMSPGLNISSIAIDYFDYSLLFGCDFDPLNGPDRQKSYVRNEIKGYYIGLPLDLKYKLGSNEKFYAKLGGEVLFLLDEKHQSLLTECGNEERKINSNTSPLTLNKTSAKVNIGFGYTFHISQKVFFIEPIVAYSLSNIYTNNNLVLSNAKSLEFGLKLGVIL